MRYLENRMVWKNIIIRVEFGGEIVVKSKNFGIFRWCSDFKNSFEILVSRICVFLRKERLDGKVCGEKEKF